MVSVTTDLIQTQHLEAGQKVRRSGRTPWTVVRVLEAGRGESRLTVRRGKVQEVLRTFSDTHWEVLV